MKFGSIPTKSAVGAILAHTVRLPGGAIKKGTTLTEPDIDRLREAGIEEIVAARLNAGDITENAAAGRIAEAVAGPNIDMATAFTGRVNLYARAAGLLMFDRNHLIELNTIHEGLTVATLAQMSRVAAGRMLATIKIIPYALPGTVIDQALAQLDCGKPLIDVAPFQRRRAGLILAHTPATKPSLITKRLEVNRRRITDLGSTLAATETVEQTTATIADAITRMIAADLDPILVFGASAIVDRDDIVPAAIQQAGGELRHFGMPVDPGNLLLLANHGARTIIGVPSCASSPKLNGLDWVLERTMAGLETSHADFAAMAPGGLLQEITSRPQPREITPAPETKQPPRIAALILAAGRSTRMGSTNKLTANLAGKPMIRHVAKAALASKAQTTTVVTGNNAAAIEAALAGLDVTFTHNPDFADGLSTSLITGIATLTPDIDGVIVLLGDMPLVTADLIDRLIAAFDPTEGRAICVPVHDGKRGNPILWAARFFSDLKAVKGDTGAKHLIGENAEWITEVDAGGRAIFRDIDTPEALAALRQEI